MEVNVKICLSSDPHVLSMLDEYRAAWFPLFEQCIRRQLLWVARSRPDDVEAHQTIDAFPWTSDGFSSMWYNYDLSPWIQVTVTTLDRDGLLDAAALEDAAEARRIVADRVLLQIEYVPDMTVKEACLVLSCLLQYSPEDASTPIHLYSLRRLILPEITKELVRASSMDFEPKHFEDMMQEWLLMPRMAYGCNAGCPEDELHGCTHRADVSARLVHDFSAPYHGRSAGCILSSAKGAGKSVFALDFLAVLRSVAPWMVNVVKRRSGHVIDHDLAQLRRQREREQLQAEQMPDLNLGDTAWGSATAAAQRQRRRSSSQSSTEEFMDREEYFEGGNFVDEPLSPKPGAPPRPPGDANTMVDLFKLLKSHAEPGKLVITFIDNIDHFTLGKTSKRLLTQMGIEVSNATFEFFLVTAGSASVLPAYDSNDYNKNLLYMPNFRTIKLFDMPLPRAFNFVRHNVEYPAEMSFSKDVVEAVAACARRPLSVDERGRRRLEHMFHNMKASDLKKVSLQVALRLGRYFQRHPEDMHEQQGVDYCQVLDDVLNSTDFLTGLAPDVVAAVEVCYLL